MIYHSSKEPFDFRTFKTTRSFGDDIYRSKIRINDAGQEQSDLVGYILNFNNKTRPKNKDDNIYIYIYIYIFLIAQKIFSMVEN